MKLLLINPRFPESFWSFQWAIDNVFANKRALSSPLGLATLAALCPADWDVEILDENIETLPVSPDAQIIGICGMGVQFKRQKELLESYRSRGYFVVAGGSYASLCPELYEPLADSVVAGEAEYIWKTFCRDFERGSAKALYRETGEVSLLDSPPPRFDLLNLDKYQAISVQFSRGCPFRCEFCDIIVMFGRKPRTKSLEQVERELDQLRERNIRSVFFVDDNLIGNKPLAKDLLAFLCEYQTAHDYWFDFGTEVSLNVAQDSGLLELFRRANFEWVFIGVESPDEDSLRETLKFQNVRGDILSSVRQLYTYGINVYGGFIVGFDHDTAATFESQHRFIMQSGIHAAMIGLLVAIPKTPLYTRLQREGRLRADADVTDNTKLGTNVLPKQMSYEELVSGYRSLYISLLEDRNIADRIQSKVSYFSAPPEHSSDSFGEQLAIFLRLLVHGLVPGGIKRLYHFARSIPFLRPTLIPLAIGDWVVGLTMQDYVNRHFVAQQNEAPREADPPLVARSGARGVAYLPDAALANGGTGRT
ncbi:MAG TPA: radical SAM protein [Candidatus Binatia bacterium]|jgi:radical SAM superfamily enzyme YgiQ (UPF0313 family)